MINFRGQRTPFQPNDPQDRVDFSQHLQDIILLPPVKTARLQNRVGLFYKIKQRPDSAGHVEIIPQGGEELLFQGGDQECHIGMREVRGQAQQFSAEFINTHQGPARGIQPFEGKMQGFPVMDDQEHKAEFAAGISPVQHILHGHHVAVVRRHFAAVPQQQSGMQPIIGQGLAGQGLGNGDLIFMMRKHQVLAGKMNIEGLPEIMNGHGRTFDMPAGPDIAPVGFIKNALFQLVKGRALQQGEIPGIVFFIVIEINCLARADLA